MIHSIIVGTAGHIDHGKTALVRALTGIDTDRLVEEKKRGISIELGFAHLDIGETRIGFVDVPGHERFVKTMLAGATGIDLLLFVVAADESVKPQTREHFDICRLLGIPQGIVVLTKMDAVDSDILDLVKLEVEEFVEGSFLEGAPVVAVSAKTGEGIAELRTSIATVAAQTPAKEAQRYFRLPIDRVFSMKGFGTVVTGTATSGVVTVEQEVELQPGGARFRVRGVEVHGTAAKRARAGQRTALNLAGEGEILRGQVVTEPGRFETTRQVDCNFQLLTGSKPLKHRAPVHFHAGTVETIAEVRLFGDSVLAPGSSGVVRFHLRDPMLLLPGDRFIVRKFSPVVTIGGGQVIDRDGPKKPSPERIEIFRHASLTDRLRQLVKEADGGMDLAGLVRRTGETAAEIERAMDPVGTLKLQQWFVNAEWFAAARQRIEKRLAAFHKEQPLAPGMPREEVRSRELGSVPVTVLDAILNSAKTVVSEGENLRLASHKLHLQQDETQAVAKIEAAFVTAGLAVPSVNDVLAASGVELARARPLLQILLRQQKLIKIGDELVFHHSALEQLKQILAQHKGERFPVGVFKDWTGVSRKYAIPLLEYLDKMRLTRREGDVRVVL